MSEQVTRTAEMRHNVGTCPACRAFLWADVTVEAWMSEPTMTADGKAHVYASARPVAVTVSHTCDVREESE